MNAKFSAVSLFAGCGGSDLGLQMAGIAPIWSNELNETASQLYVDVTGLSTIKTCDIRQIEKFPKADILAGCYPCQGYSQGGVRDDEASINFLYREFDRALRQIRPLAFIVENVDGMRFSHNKHLLDNQLVRFRSAGYRVSWAVLDAKDYGLAQQRRRLIMVGIRSSENIVYRFPRPTHGPQSSGKSYATMREVIWHLRDAPPGSYNEEPLHWYYLSRNRRHGWDQQAPCVVGHWRHVALHPDSPPLRKVGTDHWEFAAEGKARRFSYLECAALQGFPEPEAFRSQKVRDRFLAIGNAVPPPLFAAVAASLVRQLRPA